MVLATEHRSAALQTAAVTIMHVLLTTRQCVCDVQLRGVAACARSTYSMVVSLAKRGHYHFACMRG